MTDKYILDGHKPIPVADVLEWAHHFEHQSRRVAEDQFGRTTSPSEVEVTMRVSTVFLGIDHQFGDGSPLLFETMIFGGEHDQEQWRYSTWEEAEAGHNAAVTLATEKPL